MKEIKEKQNQIRLDFQQVRGHPIRRYIRGFLFQSTNIYQIVWIKAMAAIKKPRHPAGGKGDTPRDL